MDCHAVAAAFIDRQWRVVDGTLLAPWQTLVRIAIGRDAADIAFLDNDKGVITLTTLEVTAVVDGELSKDSIDQLVSSAERFWRLADRDKCSGELPGGNKRGSTSVDSGVDQT